MENNPYMLAMNDLGTLFLDWVNNYLTVEKFAEDYGFAVKHAKVAIEAGRLVHEMRIANDLA